jgi:glycine/D-amino acid oxidase-like deaminating enzyme
MAPTKASVAERAGVKHEIYWRETESVQPGPPLRGDVRTNVCIIGAGYTGMWTAHFLKLADPSIDIHIVEADYAGAGASGHNDGFVTPTIGHSMSGLVRQFGTERAAVAYGVVGRSILELGRFCRKYKVDAEMEPNGYYTVATNSGQLHRLEQELELASKLGSKNSLELLGATEARDRIGSAEILGAFKVGGALINPHRLSRGLARVVRGQGVHIHEGTPASYQGLTGDGHVVTTPEGKITADKVLLATNAYQHQFTPFRNRVRPVWSYAVVTEPLTDEQLAEVHWPGREGFVEARNFILFGRFTAQNRLLIGGGPAPYFYGRDMSESKHIRNDQLTEYLRDALGRYFPAWRDLRFSHAYGGCVAMTREFVPHVGGLGGGLFYGHGYCGNGIALTHTAGKALRDLILGRDSAYTNLLFVNGKERKVPAEPLFFLGARALSAVLAWQDRHPTVIKRSLV